MDNFRLTKLAVHMNFPGNEVIMDDAGLPSIMVYIPAFKNSDVLTAGDDNTHPAFVVNGNNTGGFYMSKYQNVVHNGMAYSLPGEDPAASITLDKASAACAAKGENWHLCTAAEWAAIALWCKKNGFIPRGNNDYGKDTSESTQTATGLSAEASRVATGTGPLTWSHDGTMSGIWDLNGNVWEWVAGMRLVWGELQILANNDAADINNPTNETSTCWKAINAEDGSFMEPESKITDTSCRTYGRSVKLFNNSGVWTFSNGIYNASSSVRSCKFSQMTCDNTIYSPAKMVLRSLALLPDEGTEANYDDDIVNFIDFKSECLFARGGRWLDREGAGVFSIVAQADRKAATSYYGFRSVYTR